MPEPLLAFVERLEQATLRSLEQADLIRLYRQLLLANPPEELLPALYSGLAEACHRNGELADALAFWELYRLSG